MPPVDVQRALQGLVGLEADDGLELGVLGIDVAGLVAGDAGDDLGVHIQDAALLALLEHEAHDLVPKLDGALGRTGQEGLVTLVGGVVLLDEVADVDLDLPVASVEAFPCFLH